MTKLSDKLVLSIFPGIDLLGRAFEESGFCIVRGPDLLWGGDIHAFHPPSDVFWGIIGGPPCQDFSSMRRLAPTGYGLEMLTQYVRVVQEAQPEWWLMENVARVPDVTMPGYVTQRLDINQAWYCDVTRLRHIQFGSKSGRLLNVTRRPVTYANVTTQCITEESVSRRVTEGAALAHDDRPFSELCRLQGLPNDFNLPGFLISEKKKAVGNGVPLMLGRALAAAVVAVYSRPVTVQRDLAGQVTATSICACGCGRLVTGKARYFDYSCRKRAQRRRDRAARSHVTS